MYKANCSSKILLWRVDGWKVEKFGRYICWCGCILFWSQSIVLEGIWWHLLILLLLYWIMLVSVVTIRLHCVRRWLWRIILVTRRCLICCRRDIWVHLVYRDRISSRLREITIRWIISILLWLLLM